MLYFKRTIRNSLFFILIASILIGCGRPAIVPMDDQSFSQVKKTLHVAGSGDTLYSIAFLAGLDYKELAAWNNISAPYVIQRGQKISLKKPTGFDSNFANDDVVSSVPNSSLINEVPDSRPITASNTITKTQTPSSTQDLARSNFDNSWKWPLSAISIINVKRSQINNGLDIISKHGVPVKASASGKVVYAGNSLKGYGNLIIIKHSETFLSAYAHNKTIHVSEGDHINQGQKIGEVGSSDAKQAKLHFEIRKNGTPVNPLGLLPKKIG